MLISVTIGRSSILASLLSMTMNYDNHKRNKLYQSTTMVWWLFLLKQMSLEIENSLIWLEPFSTTIAIF